MDIKLLLLIWFLSMATSSLWSQTDSLDKKDWWQQIRIQPVATLQVWSSYTTGQQLYNESRETYEQVSNRLNFQLRRSRLGLKGSVGDRMKFNLLVAADLVGRDVLASTEGGANNGSWPRLRLWNAYALWRLIPQREILHLSIGFQVPQLGRVSTASAFRTPSMEKPWSQNYLRRHLVGTGPGRSIGIQFGGLILANESSSKWSGRYDIGLFNPAMNTLGGNSIGRQASPLLSMRYRLSYGDVESTSYKLTTPITFQGQRWGASLSTSGAWQGKSDLFQHNHALGLDLLINLGWWTIDGEWFRLGRQELDQPIGISNWASAQTGHLRLSKLSPAKDHYLETTLTYVFFQGAMGDQDQKTAQTTQLFAGEEWYTEAAINWYFNKNLKLSGSYTYRKDLLAPMALEPPSTTTFFSRARALSNAAIG